MRHAVILSSFVPSTTVAEAVGSYYLDIINKYFSDCKIYIGVNVGSSHKWRSMMEKSGLNITICEVSERLSVNSDVAGFQAVLATLRSTRAAHDFYWFGHTKGATHERYSDAELLRDIIEQNFWSRRDEIDKYCDPARNGAFLPLPMLASGPALGVINYLKEVFPSVYPPVGAFPTYTFFGMTGVALRNFLASAEDRFFSRNLLDEPGLSRYFFEGGFSWFADMAGFKPYLVRAETISVNAQSMQSPCHPNEFALNRLKVARCIDVWSSNPAKYNFTGWPLWAGEGIEYQEHIYEPSKFFELQSAYAP